MTEPREFLLPTLETLMQGWLREAGQIARSHYRRTGELRFKQGRQAVTDADIGCP